MAVDAAVDAMADAAPARYRVRIAAAGMVEPVSVRLLATGVDELMSVTGDGESLFVAELLDGDSYTVQWVTGAEVCQMDNEVGTLQGADAQVVLVCRLIDDLTLAGALSMPELGFSATRMSYQAEVSLRHEYVTVTAVASRPDVELEIAGQPATSGLPSPALPLAMGENGIAVIARHPPSGARLDYQIVVHRASAFAQAVYGKASNTDVGDEFGWSVALSGNGDTLAVGVPDEDSAATGVDGDQSDNSALGSGAVYVFQRSGTTWAQQAYIKASNTDGGDWYDNFGRSVALSASGDTLAVGALREDSAATGIDGDQADNSALHSGAVYVFQRSGTTWAQQAYVKASNTDAHDHFGVSVALSASGDTLAVGAWGEDSAATGVDGDQADNSAGGSGAVYVFQRSGTAWIQQAYIKASNTDGGYWYDAFGGSVALSASGDTLAVSAPYEDSATTGIDGDQSDNSARHSGAVYVFQRSGTTWAQQAYVKASITCAYLEFGRSVALSGSGDTLAALASGDEYGVAVGRHQADKGTRPCVGAYVFQRSGTTWTEQAHIADPTHNGWPSFGETVALSASGDTLAVGAWGDSSAATGVDGNPVDNGAHGSGAAYVFQRSGTTWVQQAYIKASNTDAGDIFGASVALSADGDTLVAGARWEDSAATGIDGDQSDNSALGSGAFYLFDRL